MIVENLLFFVVEIVALYPSRLELRCGSKRLGRGSVMTASAVLGKA